jgi:hypothetical protein
MFEGSSREYWGRSLWNIDKSGVSMTYVSLVADRYLARRECRTFKVSTFIINVRMTRACYPGKHCVFSICDIVFG